MNNHEAKRVQAAQTAIAMIGGAAVHSTNALSMVGDLNPIDCGLGVVRATINGLLAMVPPEQNVEALPGEVRKCHKALIAARDAIADTLDRRLELVRELPAKLNGAS